MTLETAKHAHGKAVSIVVAFSAALGVIILDRLTKYMALGGLSQDRSVGVIPDIFNLTLVFNTGAAFGLLRDQTVFFILLSVSVAIYIVICLIRQKVKDPALALALGLVLGGAVGNLVDRIMLGYVIDFLDFRIWPVFNIADSCITIGVALLIWRMFKQRITDAPGSL